MQSKWPSDSHEMYHSDFFVGPLILMYRPLRLERICPPRQRLPFAGVDVAEGLLVGEREGRDDRIFFDESL